MRVSGAVALVTGANRGLGAEFAQALLDQGAAKVYAGARDISAITDPRLTPIQLDVTDPASIAAAAAQAQDVTIVINNAGISLGDPVLGDETALRRHFETNFFGLVGVTRAFAPILGANGGGTLVNVLSVLSWIHRAVGGYAASKAAAWAATNASRLELADQGTHVVGVHVGYMETDMAAHVDGPKTAPALVAAQTIEAIETGAYEVVADDISRQVKAGLAAPPEVLYQLPVRTAS
ncbi:NAD(P)-dependent dehydrogenase (short-subunit alcohol dehydrogenase family) [Kibdelosporangium banguiense]|uniref:NAD(P)-dependent dehydrogenase (Short-subunit alcohol dehydrogenase family) n=1 Tax=Kibdelosporangium banguiense TaxID=1365924 RepID=A0ABS4TFQ5_9PSEU|nr:SDR family oxidoreductase [Kibdelosporangium banguiense]MBP2323194.1 NAD(P)-dependent dehydrogenase (short-subunit alcohol dehydrogenase family) [Kibdelosporangium banguiense]